MASPARREEPECSYPPTSRRRDGGHPGRRSRSLPPPGPGGVVDPLRCDACHTVIRDGADHVQHEPCRHVVCTRCALRQHVTRGIRPARCPAPSCGGTARGALRCRYFSARVPGEILEEEAGRDDECNDPALPLSCDATATSDAARLDTNGGKDAEEPNGEVEDENTHSNHSNENPGSAARSDAGLLSPHSIEIRQNACKLLRQQPHHQRNRQRASIRPASRSSSVHRQGTPAGADDTTRLAPAARRREREASADLLDEVAADLADIGATARDIARRAAAADGEAFAAFERGLEAFSTGARRLWEDE